MIWDGQVKKGSLARVEPDGKVMRMWEAIETYMERKQPLIIIAGADYGQGFVARLGGQGCAARRRGKPSWPRGSEPTSTART